MEATYTPAQRNVLSVLYVGGITNGIHSHTIDASRGCGQWCGNLQRFGNSQQKKASLVQLIYSLSSSGRNLQMCILSVTRTLFILLNSEEK